MDEATRLSVTREQVDAMAIPGYLWNWELIAALQRFDLIKTAGEASAVKTLFATGKAERAALEELEKKLRAAEASTSLAAAKEQVERATTVEEKAAATAAQRVALEKEIAAATDFNQAHIAFAAAKEMKDTPLAAAALEKMVALIKNYEDAVLVCQIANSPEHAYLATQARDKLLALSGSITDVCSGMQYFTNGTKLAAYATEKLERLCGSFCANPPAGMQLNEWRALHRAATAHSIEAAWTILQAWENACVKRLENVKTLDELALVVPSCPDFGRIEILVYRMRKGLFHIELDATTKTKQALCLFRRATGKTREAADALERFEMLFAKERAEANTPDAVRALFLETDSDMTDKLKLVMDKWIEVCATAAALRGILGTLLHHDYSYAKKAVEKWARLCDTAEEAEAMWTTVHNACRNDGLSYIVMNSAVLLSTDKNVLARIARDTYYDEAGRALKRQALLKLVELSLAEKAA